MLASAPPPTPSGVTRSPVAPNARLSIAHSRGLQECYGASSILQDASEDSWRGPYGVAEDVMIEPDGEAGSGPRRGPALAVRPIHVRALSSGAPSPPCSSTFRLLIQQGCDLARINVRLVVPEEPRVGEFRQLLALQRLDRGLDALVADPHRVLRDRTRHGALPDGVHLLLARVVADDDDLARLLQLDHRIQDPDRRALVGTEKSLEVRMRLDDGFG